MALQLIYSLLKLNNFKIPDMKIQHIANQNKIRSKPRNPLSGGAIQNTALVTMEHTKIPITIK